MCVFLGLGNGKFQAPITYEAGGNSVAIADLNGDGIPDLAVAGIGYVAVLLGNGNGTFQPAVQVNTAGYDTNTVAIGDLNGDGIADLVVTVDYPTAEVLVLLGNGNGTFQAPVVYGANGGVATSVAIGDLNGDGKLDLVVSNSCFSCTPIGTVSVLLGNGDGTFQTAVPYGTVGVDTESVAIADVNLDGKPDLIAVDACNGLTNCPFGGINVLLGNGDGTFQPAVQFDSGGEGAQSVAVADVNGDGKPDLAVLNFCQGINSKGACVGENVVSVFAGNGDGTFQTPVNYALGGDSRNFTIAGVAIADLNGDGRPDIAALNSCLGPPLTCNGSVFALLNIYTAATTTSVTSSLNPAPIDTPVTFTATVTSTTLIPNGTVVTFYNGTTKVGTGTTTNGVASLTTSFAKAGTFTIKATVTAGGYLKTSSGTVKQVIAN